MLSSSITLSWSVPSPDPVLTRTVYVVPETGVTLAIEALAMPELVTSPKSLNGEAVSTPVMASENLTVKFTLAALVGFGSARVIDVTAGRESKVNSYAPRSGAAPLKPSLIPGISTPRSMLGLDDSNEKSPAAGSAKPGTLSC